MTSRRSFMQTLIGLPFVGGLFAAGAAVPVVADVANEKRVFADPKFIGKNYVVDNGLPQMLFTCVGETDHSELLTTFDRVTIPELLVTLTDAKVYRRQVRMTYRDELGHNAYDLSGRVTYEILAKTAYESIKQAGALQRPRSPGPQPNHHLYRYYGDERFALGGVCMVSCGWADRGAQDLASGTTTYHDVLLQVSQFARVDGPPSLVTGGQPLDDATRENIRLFFEAYQERSRVMILPNTWHGTHS
jgi:hypothetical protein